MQNQRNYDKDGKLVSTVAEDTAAAASTTADAADAPTPGLGAYAADAREAWAEDAPRNASLEEASRRLEVPIVAVGDAHTHVSARQPLQDVVTCIRHGVTIQQVGRRLQPNAQRTLRADKHVIPQFSLGVALQLGQVEIGA